MIEKMAGAVWEQRKKCAKEHGIDLDKFETEELFIIIKSEIVNEIRAMLATLREPTPDMLYAPAQWFSKTDPFGLVHYQSMIDAALK